MSEIHPETPTQRDEPFLPELPEGRPRGIRNDQVQLPILDLRTTTLLMGGGAVTRKVDTVDLLRPSAIRGHLRFWWRALEGHKFASSRALHEAEAEIWGTARDENTGGRSRVEVRVEIEKKVGTLIDEISYKHPAFYALWTARPQNDGTAAAQRFPSGIDASLTIVCPARQQGIVARALRAWILFGGIGSRTRRGVGSLTCCDDEWLPDLTEATNEAEIARRLNEYLGGDYFGATGVASHPFPLLAGSQLVVAGNGGRKGSLERFPDAERAWWEALRWLREFRQKPAPQNLPPTASDNDFARDAIHSSKRNSDPHPGPSRWPEADKMRHLDPARYSDGHRTRHNRTPVWPRAGFGLPIVGKFQYLGDRSKFEINWRDNAGTLQQRMASPLIVKALPVRGGGFLACALWLRRSDPEGKVVLVQSSGGSRQIKSGSDAEFSRLIAPGDASLYAPIQPGKALPDSFLDWIAAKPSARRVA